MAIGPRDYKESTIKRLFALSGNECAFSSCEEKIVLEGRDDFMVNICHIEAAEPNGQRYNPNMTDDERRSFENLILFCPNHHIETNDVIKFPVGILKEIKSEHEAKMLRKSSSEGILNKYPTSLVEIINEISSLDLSNEINAEGVTDSFTIDEKITYNNIIRFKPIIEEYRVYQGKLNKLYLEIEQQGSFKKEQLLENIKILYLKAKGKVLSGNYAIENIQTNADNLLEEVEKGLWDLAEKSSNLLANIPYEAISLSISVILVDAFMRCKILEEPAKNDN